MGCCSKWIPRKAGADFVFEDDYNLITIETLKEYIKPNKHLPDVPSAKEMQIKGLDLGCIAIMLLQKMRILLLFITFFICNFSFAQTDTVQPAINIMARNTVYADFYGNGFQYSLSYDRILSSKNRWLSSITVGGTYLPYRVENYTAYKIVKERGQSWLG